MACFEIKNFHKLVSVAFIANRKHCNLMAKIIGHLQLRETIWVCEKGNSMPSSCSQDMYGRNNTSLCLQVTPTHFYLPNGETIFFHQNCHKFSLRDRWSHLGGKLDSV